MDGLRGACALAVMALHTSFLTGSEIVPGAYLAVDIFFLMSGFVLAYAYERKLAGGRYFGAFVLRRYARVAPMWLIGSLIGLAAAVPGAIHARSAGRPLAALALSTLILPVPWSDVLFPYNLPGWSLFFELLVNLLYAAVAFRLRLGGLAAIAAVGLAMVVVTVLHHGSANTGFSWETAAGGAARSLFGFFVGVIVFRLHARYRWRFAGRAVPALVLLGVLAALLAPVPPGWRAGYDLAVIALLFPAALTALVGAAGHWPAAERLGALSYPLYAVHFGAFLFVRTLAGLLSGWHRLYVPASVAVAVCVGVVAFAYLLGRRVDPAVQAWVARRLRIREVGVPGGHGLSPSAPSP